MDHYISNHASKSASKKSSAAGRVLHTSPVNSSFCSSPETGFATPSSYFQFPTGDSGRSTLNPFAYPQLLGSQDLRCFQLDEHFKGTAPRYQKPVRSEDISSAFNPKNNFKSHCFPSQTSSNFRSKNTGDSSYRDSSFIASSLRSQSRQSGLPAWSLTLSGSIQPFVTVEMVLERGDLIAFATDKIGCQFLQNVEHIIAKNEILRKRIFKEVVGSKEVFLMLCKNMFGNFFVQRVVEFAEGIEEQEMVKSHLASEMSKWDNNLCLDNYSLFAIPMSPNLKGAPDALTKLSPSIASSLVDYLPRDALIIEICTDQNANHVIQKVLKTISYKRWMFLVNFFARQDCHNLMAVCQDKYGCRVVQTMIEMLSNEYCDHQDEDRRQLLQQLMANIVANCSQLASNEFANYVVQHVLGAKGDLEYYRDVIIEKCLLRNLLSMSQEKYASHVIERAFTFAPPRLLAELFDEIFDGYVPHPETKKDALDILLFHQFGNYVIQRMLKICRDARAGVRKTGIRGVDWNRYENWFARMGERVYRDRARLERFSSGKKIIDILTKADSYESDTSSSSGFFDISACNKREARDSHWNCSKQNHGQEFIYRH